MTDKYPDLYACEKQLSRIDRGAVLCEGVYSENFYQERYVHESNIKQFQIGRDALIHTNDELRCALSRAEARIAKMVEVAKDVNIHHYHRLLQIITIGDTK